MKLPKPFHLPEVRDDPAWRIWRDLGVTGLRVPVLSPPEVRRVWDRLDVAAAAWRTLTLEERVEHLGGALRVLGEVATRVPGTLTLSSGTRSARARPTPRAFPLQPVG